MLSGNMQRKVWCFYATILDFLRWLPWFCSLNCRHLILSFLRTWHLHVIYFYVNTNHLLWCHFRLFCGAGSIDPFAICFLIHDTRINSSESVVTFFSSSVWSFLFFSHVQYITYINIFHPLVITGERYRFWFRIYLFFLFSAVIHQQFGHYLSTLREIEWWLAGTLY